MRKLKYVLKRALFRLSPGLAAHCNIDFRLHAPNRAFLENEIFTYVNRLAAESDAGLDFLFVGLDKHNWHYPRLLSVDFHSLDLKKKNAVYGRRGRHKVGNAMQMAELYAENAFDVVVANGLIGFGVDTQADFHRLIAQCHWVLKPGGLLVLGYNDRLERAPFPVDVDGNGGFDEFVPDIVGVRGARHHMDDEHRHVYVFSRKTGHLGNLPNG